LINRTPRTSDHAEIVAELRNPPPFGLREHLATLFRHKEKIALVLLATVAVSVIGSFAASPVFEAHSRILIHHNRQPLQIQAQLAPTTQLQQGPTLSDIRTEVEIFKSPVLIYRLVDELGSQTILDKMTWRWDWLWALPGEMVRYLKQLPSDIGISGSDSRASSDTEEARAKDDRLLAAEKVYAHLTAEPIGQADVFQVSFESPNPAFTAMVLNKLNGFYIEHHLALRQSSEAAAFFSSEADRLRTELQAAERRLDQFKSDTGIVDPDEQQRLLLSHLSGVEMKYRAAQLDAIEIDQRISETQRQLAAQDKAVPLSTVSDRNPLLDKLRTRLVQLELERKQFVASSPVAEQLDREISDVKKRMSEEGENVSASQTSGINETRMELQKTLASEEGERTAIKARMALATQVSEYRTALKDLNQKARQFHVLTREVELKEEALRLYLRKAEESRFNDMLDRRKITNARPIEPAMEPTKPIRPNKKRNLIIGVLLGILGGIGLAYIAEYFRRSLANTEEVQVRLGQRVLAVLPLFKRKQRTQEPTKAITAIRDHLERAKRQTKANSILITSSTAGEGKTTFADYVCQAMAREGFRILQVDGNLAKAPGLRPDGGESETPEELDNSDADARPETKMTRHGNLFRLSARQRNDQTASFRMLAKALPTMVGKFDYIFVDGPAMGSCPEVLTLAESTDTTIVVVEADRTIAMSVAETIRHLEEADVHVLGIVLNKRRYVIPGWIYHRLLTPSPSRAYA
jgi:polysaccharide biosynthesis transport protein